MTVRIVFLILLLISMSACKSLAPRFQYQAEPRNYAWYLRTHIEPLAVKVAGIPVQRFNPDWCFANELRTQDFPPELAQKLAADRALQLASGYSQVDFKLKQPYGLEGPDYVSIGSFHNCATNEYGTFVFAIKQEKLLDVVGFGPSTFAILSTWGRAGQKRQSNKTEQASPISTDFEVFWQECFECDVVARVTWDASHARFGRIQSLMPPDE